MKRALLTSFMVCVAVFAIACARGQNQNTNQSLVPAANKPVQVTITWVPASGANPEQITIAVDDGVKISKPNGDTVRWKVKYAGPASANAATVTLDNFTNTQNANDKDPFGNGSSADNKFTFDPQANGPEKTKDTLTASKSGAFKYRITATLPDGPVVTVDPVVIIDN